MDASIVNTTTDANASAAGPAVMTATDLKRTSATVSVTTKISSIDHRPMRFFISALHLRRAATNAYFCARSSRAASSAKYVRMPSAPARLNASSDSIIALSWSSQPFCAAAFSIAYSPLT